MTCLKHRLSTCGTSETRRENAVKRFQEESLTDSQQNIERWEEEVVDVLCVVGEERT